MSAFRREGRRRRHPRGALRSGRLPRASRKSRTASHSSNAMSRLRTIPWSCGIDPLRIQPGELVSARRAGPLQGEVVFEVEAELGTRHAGDVRRVPQALLVPRHAAALVLLAASAGAGLVASDPLDGPASRRGGRLSSSSSRPSRRGARASSRNGSVHRPAAGRSVPAGSRATRPVSSSSPSRSDVAARKASTSRPRATRASMRARRTISLAVPIEPPLAAPVGRQEEGHGLPLPGQAAVRNGPDERPDHVARMRAPRAWR